ncbi:autotransporter outer membrane beta-barrel domain-containing protein [Dasania marina]|uniref:autotransporter outer membrane beta-barrel domain-containing protein n=1 Tax=Dasania marina TaxID=471499 RepID=UPI0003610DF9|nr:autotransporter outer membrane beta-barrel domain-containing protein [Dasania marina]
MKNNKSTGFRLLLVTACTLGLQQNADADLLSFQGQYQSELEERSAISNQAVYDQLKASGCDDVERAATSSCSGATFVVWNNVRELVHTANELTNSGPTLFSLDSNLEGLGFALRWTAGEEFASEESLVDSFVSGQLSGLASRITALRSGARGFNIAGVDVDGNGELARISKYSSGLNAGDQTSDLWSRLGGFINGSYTYGDQEGSEREDAFDFDGAELNAGLDYRLDDHWVVGGLLGYISEEVDFDAEKSIVDGGVTMDGLSLSTFVLYQSDSWFYSASIGYQYSDFTTTRSIRYPSFNPNTTSTNTEARSSNDAHTLTTNMSAGYSFFVTDTITIEPSVSVNYQDVSIDEYREKDINNDGFDFVVSKQNIDSLETVASLKTQYTLTTQYGVFMPFVDLQYYSQHKSDQRFIEAAYVGAMETLTSDAYFLLPTNSVEVDYKIYSFGVAAVIRGAQQTTFGSAASGGIQVYLNFREIKDIGDYSQKILSGGLRYEF